MSKRRIPQLPDQYAMDLLAANVRKYRMLRDLSQESLANLSGIEHSTVSRIKRGLLNASVSVIVALAKAMEVEPKQLLEKLIS